MTENNITKKDLSKSVIVILVILSVIISVLSTWVVLEEVNRYQGTPVLVRPGTKKDSGKVSITVKSPDDVDMVSTTGQVSINVLKEV
jgi:hypothetical protein